jgi:hypothetical protein
MPGAIDDCAIWGVREKFMAATLESRQAGDDQTVLAVRPDICIHIRQRNPVNWPCKTRKWLLIDGITLDPAQDMMLNMDASVQAAQSKCGVIDAGNILTYAVRRVTVNDKHPTQWLNRWTWQQNLGPAFPST